MTSFLANKRRNACPGLISQLRARPQIISISLARPELISKPRAEAQITTIFLTKMIRLGFYFGIQVAQGPPRADFQAAGTGPKLWLIRLLSLPK